MKKLTLLIAALVLSFTAQATIVNCSPNTDAIDWWMTKGDTLVFADGEYIQTYSLDFDKAGIVLMAAEGAKPVIKNSSYFKIHATTTFIGITFDGQNTSNHALTTRGEATKDLILTDCEFKNFVQYNIEIKENTTLTTLNIENCVFDGTNTTPDAIYGKGIVSQTTIQGSEFKNYTEYCIYANDYYGARYDNLTINNCLFHDCAYSAVFLANAKDGLEKQSCSDFTLTNSTIYNVGAASTKGRGVVELRTNSNITSDQEVLIDHVTLYNFASSENAWSGGFYIGNSANSKISNCIAMNPEDKKTLYANPYHAYTGAEITNSLYFNCDYNAEHGATTSESLVKADPKFVDAANADFMLYAESPAVGAGTDGSNLGDPRWGVKAGIQPGEGKLKDAVEAAQPGATIILGDETYEVSSSISCDEEGLTIKAAEGTKPIISFTGSWSSLKLSATTTFEGIIFDGGGVAYYPITTEGENTGTFTFNNCVFKNYLYFAISNNNATVKTNINSVIVNNCIFHDGGAAIYMNNQANCSNLAVQNTTIYNIAGAANYIAAIHIDANATDATLATKTLLDHLTIYNIQTSASVGAITIENANETTISNCIIASPEQKSIDSYNVPAGATIQNCLVHNQHLDDVWNSIITKADPLFVDAANANFMLSANSPAVGAGTNGSNLGDTRWGVSASLKGKVINIEPGEQTLAAAVGYSVSPGDTIVLKDGTYEEPYSINFNKEGLVVMAAEGATPVIALTGQWTALNVSASTTFDGITFDGKNVAKYIIATLDSTAMTTDLTIKNCEFKNWLQWAISNQYENNVSTNSVVIDNCLFHNGTNSAVYFSEKAPEGKNACQDLKITNSTFYNIGDADAYTTIYCVGGNAVDAQKVTVDHCTFYNCQAKSTDHGAVRVSCAATISNTIIVAPESQGTYRAIYAADNSNAQAINCLTFNYEKDNGGVRSAASKTDCYLNTDPLFVDAANNNFMLQANSPAIGKATDGTNLGDPRWGVEEPTLITLTTGDNSQVITDNIGKTVNVKIARSFKANDGYYTLCVPFNMPASIIGTVYEIDGIEEYTAGQGGGLSINLNPVTNLLAGVPYLVEPKENMNELVVEGVIIANDKPSEDYSWNNGMVKLSFQGCYSADGKTDGATEYYIGNGGYLYNNVVDKRGLCGFLTITDNDDNPVNIRARVVTREEVETGLDNNQLPNINIQKVLENGQLIIIRDGVKYNVQGQKL